VPVHASPPSRLRPRRRVSSAPALRLLPPANRPFLGLALSLSLSRRAAGSIDAEGVVGKWKRKEEEGKWAGEASLITTGRGTAVGSFLPFPLRGAG
jgi:hypothetical protein